MDSEKYEKISALFLQVCDLPLADQPAAVERLCGDDPELRAEIESMLVVDSRDGLQSAAALVALAADRAESNGSLPCVPGYEILERLGEGGMGIVWRAVQCTTRREVALKRINAAALGSERAKARFIREIEIAARLEHPGIVRVYDSGIVDGVPFYAMELIDGIPLDQYVDEAELDRREVLELIHRGCQSVQHAHSRGLIHRDLKPANIVVTGEGQPHVLDFGLAVSVLPDAPGWRDVSTTGQMLGTPAFMSPEQAAGRPDALDTRSDVYSLGVILYRLLTGDSPHDLSGTPLTVMQRIAESEVCRPSVKDRTIDADLEALLLKALSSDPDLRYGTAGELADDIRSYLDGEPLRARRPTLRYIAQNRLRKYKLAVVLVAVAAVLSVVAVTSYIVSIQVAQRKTLAAERDARGQRDQANAARDLAERWSTVLRVQAADRALHATGQTTDAAEADRLLDLCPNHLRGWAWHRLKWARDRSELSLGPFDADVRQMFLTPDRSRLVAVLGAYARGDRSRIVLFDAQTLQAVMTLRGHDGLIFRAGITPDGTQIYSCGRDKTLRRWNVETGELVETIDVGTELTDVGFTPDDRYVIWADIQRGLVVRDRETGAHRLIPLAGQHGQDYRLAVSPDGRYVAWLTREWRDPRVGHLKLVELATGRQIWQQEAPDARKVLFMPDSDSILVNWQEEIQQFDTASGSHIKSWYRRHAHAIGDMVLSPDGTRLATVGYWDQRVILWDATSAECLATFLGHAAELYSVTFSGDGRRLLSGGMVAMNPFIKVWDIANNSDCYVLARYDRSTIAAMSSDGRSIVSLGDDRVTLHDRKSRELKWQVDCEMDQSPPRGVAPARIAIHGEATAHPGRIAIIHPLSRDPAGPPACRLTLLRMSTGETISARDFDGQPSSIAFSHDGSKLALGIWGKPPSSQVVIVDVNSANLAPNAAEFKLADRGEKTPVAFSPDDRHLATLSSDTLWILDVESGKSVRHRDFPSAIHDVKYLLDGKILLCHRENEINVLDPQNWSVIRTTHSNQHLIDAAAGSDDGQSVLVVKSNTEIQVFDRQLDVRLATLAVPYAQVTYAGWTPDGRTIVSSHADGTVRLWETGDGS